VSMGRVALVGAGPGDPALLTVRAAELLRTADVVAHDELVSESILALVPAHAELIAVGRRAGRGATGYRLHPLVMARALAGLVVVRLKAGDPLVFGRGGEEAEELAAAGVPFEIVPGISAALGAASYAGIPLTHRGLAAQLVVTSGHRADGGVPPPGASSGRTLALYMAAHELEVNLAAIVRAGWSKATPAALVIAATTPDERAIIGTLATLSTLAERALTSALTLPALVIIGEVVTMRASIEWRSRLALRGRRVLVARALARSRGTRIALELRTLGADVVELPHRFGTPPARWPSRIDLVVLPTSLAASALYSMAPARVRAAPALALGASAESAARRFDIDVVRADGDSPHALAAAAERALSTSRPSPAPSFHFEPRTSP
jgi:uroporphyrinogen III methyltransferase/synthase